MISAMRTSFSATGMTGQDLTTPLIILPAQMRQLIVTKPQCMLNLS